MKILLDTCILSELRRQDCDKKLIEFINGIPDENIFISVISTGEITKGISLLDEGKKKKELQSWINSLEKFYEDRILSIDLETTQIWGEITAHAQKNGITIPALDGIIASTARRYGLHLLTRNIPDFEHTGVMLVDI
ncbi:MAG: type II toxin-antitoxin system VapC family toxin [Thermodesulfobacteriota bacterium]